MDAHETYPTQIAWLLEGDPAIRYHTLKDLVKVSGQALHHERQRILREGWGRRLLDLQEEDGTWSHALYSPKWTSTLGVRTSCKRLSQFRN